MAQGAFESKSFFSSLFDFSFTSFVTLRFMKLIYGLLVVLICLGGAIFLLSGILSGSRAAAVLALIGVPPVTLFYLILARVYMELIALFFRIGENTSLVVSLLQNPDRPPPSEGPAWGAPSPPMTPPH